LSNVVAIAAGGDHGLALKSDGTVVGWGRNDFGQASPPARLSNVVAIAAGGSHSLALRRDGTVVAWGDNESGQAIPPAGLSNVVAIAAGGWHSLALRSDGTVVGWGWDIAGQATPPAGLSNVVAIAAGGYYSLALVATDDFYESSDGPPKIVQQPRLENVALRGESLLLTAQVTSSTPLYYQWFKDGMPVPGATNLALILNNLTSLQCGVYRLRVWNIFGATESLPACLAVLDNPTLGTKPKRPEFPQLPPRSPGKTGLIVVTHGWIRKGVSTKIWEKEDTTPELPTWVETMAAALSKRVSPEWTVMPWYWTNEAYTVTTWAALANAERNGRRLGETIADQGWKHVHMIAHSAGSALIHEAASAIREAARNSRGDSVPTIHLTFLDAYGGLREQNFSSYGSTADWADHYFAQDKLTGLWTDSPIKHAFNVDVTWTDDLKGTVSYVNTGREECISALSDHSGPIEFYRRSIERTLPPCAAGYGFDFSKEAGGWETRPDINYGEDVPTICAPPAVCRKLSSQQTHANSTVVSVVTLPLANSRWGTSIERPSGGNDTDTFLKLYIGEPLPWRFRTSPPLDIHSAGDTEGGDTEAPWLTMAVTVTNPVNVILFECSLEGDGPTEGLLTVYWNSVEIGRVDQRGLRPGFQEYTFGLPGTVTNGVYTLGFRFDRYGPGSVEAVVRNLQLGYVGPKGPVHLQIQLARTQTGETQPELVLRGPAGVVCILESSSDLVEWQPWMILETSEGETRVADQTLVEQSQARFYRVVVPGLDRWGP
jgi:hypothetical protein